LSRSDAGELILIIGDPIAQVEAARRRNCKTSIGADLFTGALGPMVAFFLEGIK